MTLHIITKPDSQSQSIHHCLSILNNKDAILFIEDGTYCYLNKTLMQQIDNNGIPTFWLRPDMNARGLPTSDCTNLIDYDGFVTLTERHHPSQTWG